MLDSWLTHQRARLSWLARPRARFERDQANAFRYRSDLSGHYESYFVRANHPTRPQAFWLRYTLFSPKAQPEAALGELWAVWFDAEAGAISAAKQAFPLADCRFSTSSLSVRIGGARLDGSALAGQCSGSHHELSWRLTYLSPTQPLLLLPEALYSGSWPKAKALVSSPLARFSGEIFVDGQRHVLADWLGSQNHNWGSQHTDRYAWGQVAGFDEDADAFLECASARVRVGPLFTPAMSPLVLRIGSEEFRFASLGQALRARAHYEPFHWRIRSRNEDAELEVAFEAKPSDFVALPYDNPPGGQKICLNSKLASCRLELRRRGKPALQLATRHRAAFEILRDQPVPGVWTLAGAPGRSAQS